MATKQVKAAKSDLVVLKVGHAFVAGKGKDAKPKKDSLWGLIQEGNLVIKFFGRKGGAMRFKVAESLQEANDLYAQKLTGTDAKKLKHKDLSADDQAELLGFEWPEVLFSAYKKAVKDQKVDNRVYPTAAIEAHQGDGKKAPEPVTELAPWPYPKSPV